MIRESDMAALLIGIAALAFAIHYHARLRAIPAFDILFASFGALLIGWLASAAEEIGPGEALSIVKHASNAIGGLMIFWWCRQALRKEDRG